MSTESSSPWSFWSGMAMPMARRRLSYFYWNFTETNATDFDEQNLVKAQDVSVDAVLTSIFLNAVVFVLLMCFYECLRRMLPAVYSSRKRLKFAREGRDKGHSAAAAAAEQQQQPPTPSAPPLPSRPADGIISDDDTAADAQQQQKLNTSTSEQSLPDDRPLDWVGPVFGVPWSKVRKTAGLDGYFFLRFIRMHVRIAAVSTFWFFVILVPVYATGSSDPYTSAPGWYHLSAANVPAHGWRMWMPCIFLYLFSGFIFFVVKQEYRHFLELRQDFLARGTIHIHPQHHYSLMVENVPYDLRSDRALADYFRKLFPGSVHSASVVLKLPDLEEAANRCTRSCRRLEKSIAFLHATGRRPMHIVGRGRMRVLGVDLAPLECRPCGGGGGSHGAYYDSDEDDCYAEMADDPQPHERPPKGTRVDSISYYTQELAAHSRALFRMQKRKGAIAESGNRSFRAANWLEQVVREASLVAARIMDDSVQDNALISPSDSYDGKHMAETMSSNYGSISPATLPTPPIKNSMKVTVEDAFPGAKSETPLVEDDDHLVSADFNF